MKCEPLNITKGPRKSDVTMVNKHHVTCFMYAWNENWWTFFKGTLFYLQYSLTTANERISRNFHLLLNLKWNRLTALVRCCLIRKHQAASLWEASRVPMTVNLVLPTMLGLSAQILPISLFFWGTHQDKKLRTSTLPLKSCCKFLRDLSPVKSAVGAARVWRYRDWFWRRVCLFWGARC